MRIERNEWDARVIGVSNLVEILHSDRKRPIQDNRPVDVHTDSRKAIENLLAIDRLHQTVAKQVVLHKLIPSIWHEHVDGWNQIRADFDFRVAAKAG